MFSGTVIAFDTVSKFVNIFVSICKLSSLKLYINPNVCVMLDDWKILLLSLFVCWGAIIPKLKVVL